MEIVRAVRIGKEATVTVALSGPIVTNQTKIEWVPNLDDPRFGRFHITKLKETIMAKKVKQRLFKKAKGRTLYIGKTVRKDKDSSFRLTHQKSGRVISYESMTRAKKDGWVEVK
jgi:hypothetical protein